MSEEFEKIKSRIAYFDSNVIQHMMNQESLNGELRANILVLLHLMQNEFNRDNWCLPYSQAHLEDISNSKEEYIKKDLEYLYNFSRGWVISEDISDRNLIRIDKVISIQEYFDWFIKQKETSDRDLKVMNEIFNPIYSEVSILFKEFKNTQDHKNQEVEDILEILNSFNDPDFGLKVLKLNKKMKMNNNKEGNIKYPQINIESLNESGSALKEKVHKLLQNSKFPIKSFEEFRERFFNTHYSILSDLHNEILCLSLFAEYLGIVQEKANKENSFNSIITDQKHLTYALKSKVFISADERLLKKAQFIKAWIGSNTLIFNIKEFNEFLLRQIVIQDIEAGIKSNEQHTFNFFDSDSQLIKSYLIQV
ncbi:MAG: hypothetical protein IPO06_04545 [Leptospiraceae bacterium]|nr:hypothetical protein [Leptospiraceae bacterium]MBP9890046.1 hypothetical protein [Leptospiraceae bacterium]